MNEVVDIETIRFVFKSLMDFEKELLAEFEKDKNILGSYGCEKVIQQMTKALNTLERYKITTHTTKEIA